MVKEGITLIICKQIPAAQLDTFVSGHPYGHYMKTSMWAALQKRDQPHFRFFGDHDELKGTAMILNGSRWVSTISMFPGGLVWIMTILSCANKVCGD